MMLFGKYLVECGALTRRQLVDATQSQVIFGGRLGTNLVEHGYLQVDELERHLSDHLGLPVAPSEWLEHPDAAALKKVPADLVTRHAIFPLALEQQTLHLAMSDPRNPGQVDDSAFATGLRIQPYVISELRLTRLLERHYRIRRETRYIEVGSDLEQDPHASGTLLEAPPSVSIGIAEAERDGVVDPLGADQELIDEETFTALQAGWQSRQMGIAAKGGPHSLPDPRPATPEAMPKANPASTDCSVAEDVAIRLQAEPDPRAAALAAVTLESALESADDRDRVVRLALRLARLHARAAAVFIVRGGMIAAFRGDGEAIETDIDGLLVRLDAETIFATAATSGQPWRGQPPTAGTSRRVLNALGRRDVRDALVLPITVREHVINLLYVDNAGEPLAETAVAAICALGGCVSQAYERLIVEGKSKFT